MSIRDDVAGIAAERADQDRAHNPSPDKRPTSKQTWMIAHLFAEIAGVNWPESRRGASELISTLIEQRDAVRAASAEVPF